MTVQEIMERLGINSTGRAIAYIKDGLDEMNFISETHVKTAKIDINLNQRFYDLPNDAVKVLDVRCKHHNNDSNLYKSIPRSVYEPPVEDEDGI
tara:strand:+ start:2695 stop:2976 length:282 start_codon:yes stop_codon:yes gene_type:complete